MSAMGTHESIESEDGKGVTDKLIAFHVARAKGGCGLNTIEVTSVDAARIRQETGMLTMPCGRINTPEYAEQILQEDKADLIVMARAQLADPDFCNKAQEGRLNDIRYCIGCNQECYDYFAASLSVPNINHITCMRNPALLEEEAWGLKQGNTSKKVLIIGGGIAGIVAALDLKKTGNKPVIFEKENHLGGQFVLAGAAPGKSDFHYAAKKAAANVMDQEIHKIASQFSLAKLPRMVHTDTTCKAIEGNKVIAQKEDQEISFQADLFVMAVGTKSAETTAFQEVCQKLEIPVYLIGDAKKAPCP